MADQYLGEIRIFGFTFAPTGWALCNGQLLPISQNTALFSLLGTNFGGNGTSTFALPNLQGSVPVDQGQGPALTGYVVGETGGSPSVTLLQSQMPAHTHTLQAHSGRTVAPPHETPAAGDSLATANEQTAYGADTSALTTLAPAELASAGGGAAHNNMMPTLVLNYCIALTGIYPPRS
jgi:microcystin-dependent protein